MIKNYIRGLLIMKKNILLVLSGALLSCLSLFIIMAIIDTDFFRNNEIDSNFEENATPDVAFPSTNMFFNLEVGEWFGETVSRPETAIIIARAVLNDWTIRRFGESHSAVGRFDEDHRSDFDENHSMWIASAEEKEDVWVVIFEFFVPDGTVTLGPGNRYVTIRKSDGKIISVYII